MTDYIGLRVARWRDIGGMTQQELADAVGVSRAYISLIESGDRAVTKRSLLISLAEALGVSVQQLLDQPPEPRNQEDLMVSRAAAAVRVALDSDAPVRPNVATLKGRADALVAMRAACDYSAMAEALPAILAEGQAAEDLTGTNRRIVLDALVKAAVYGAFWLKTGGYVDLSRRLAERAELAAREMESATHAAAATMAACQTLMAAGVRARAFNLAARGADALQPNLAARTDDGARGWYVNLRQQAALCAASVGDSQAARAHLDDAADAARHTRPDVWHRDDQVVDCDVWRVTVALENGDPESAPDLTRRIDRSKLRTPQRLARVYIDAGRGHYARNSRELAVAAFSAAYDVAPGEVRNRGTVREIVSQMLREAPAAGGSEALRSLASRMQIDPIART